MVGDAKRRGEVLQVPEQGPVARDEQRHRDDRRRGRPPPPGASSPGPSPGRAGPRSRTPCRHRPARARRGRAPVSGAPASEVNAIANHLDPLEREARRGRQALGQARGDRQHAVGPRPGEPLHREIPAARLHGPVFAVDEEADAGQSCCDEALDERAPTVRVHDVGPQLRRANVSAARPSPGRCRPDGASRARPRRLATRRPAARRAP